MRTHICRGILQEWNFTDYIEKILEKQDTDEGTNRFY